MDTTPQGKRFKFTTGRISAKSCPHDKTQELFWDSEQPGLGLRVTPAGSTAYIFQGWVGGKAVRTTIGRTNVWSIEEARQEARRLKVLVDQGVNPTEQRREQAEEKARAKVDRAEAAERAAAEMRRQATTVAEAWHIYIEHHARRWGARHMRDHHNLAHAGGAPKVRGRGLTVQGVLAPVMQWRMADVTANRLATWVASEAATRATNARQGFELFRAFWRWCVDRPEYAGFIDPRAVEAKDLRAEVPTRKSKRFDVLERAHLASWFDAMRSIKNPVISAYLQGLLLTGARREELAQLKWDDVDFSLSAMWVKDKIDASGRKVPLTPYLASLIHALPRRNEWVFSSPLAEKSGGHIAEPRIAHVRALSAAGLPHVSLHGLRRTFASLAEWVEMPRGIVAQIMGHKPSATAERHYINRPLELLAIWHCKYEGWILEQAGISPPAAQHHKLRSVK